MVKEADWYYSVGGEDGVPAEKRRLNFMATVGTVSTAGCYVITNAATVSFDVSSATGCGSGATTFPCPDCFTTTTLSRATTLTITSCSSAAWVRSQSRTGVWEYTFINLDSTYTLTVVDSSGAGTTYNVPPGTHARAFCSSSYGTTNKLVWPSYRVPTLTVDSGLTLSAGNFDASSSSGTFKSSTGTNTLSGNVVISGSNTFTTGTGTVSLLGATTVADNTAFTVGSSGNGGVSTMYGNVVIGAAANLKKLTVYGAFDQQGSSQTFSTATGVISLNGDIEVAADMSITMLSGTGSFTTGTGTVSLLGNTAISGSKTFTTGTGAVSLMGPTTIAASQAFTVGTSAGGGGTTTIYGNVVIGGSSAGQTKTVTHYGSFSQLNGADGSQTFSTATGAITLNGDVTVSANKNLGMVSTSTGTFTTGAGDVMLNGDVTISGSKTFHTGTGSVSLNGATTVAGDMPFSVGAPGTGGDSQFFGNVYIGGSSGATSKLLDVYGNVVFRDDVDGTTKTFNNRQTGQTSYYGNVFIAAGKNFEMDSPGGGLFMTGTGAVSLRGDVTITDTHTFTYTAESSAAITCRSNPTYTGSLLYCAR